MKISEQTAELERENERLSRLVDAMTEEIESLKQNPPAGEIEQAKDYLIDVLSPEIVWAEENLKSMSGKQRERVTEIVSAYRAVREKGEQG